MMQTQLQILTKFNSMFAFTTLKFGETGVIFRFIMDPMEENIFLEEHMKLTFSIMNDLRKRKELCEVSTNFVLESWNSLRTKLFLRLLVLIFTHCLQMTLLKAVKAP